MPGDPVDIATANHAGRVGAWSVRGRSLSARDTRSSASTLAAVASPGAAACGAVALGSHVEALGAGPRSPVAGRPGARGPSIRTASYVELARTGGSELWTRGTHVPHVDRLLLSGVWVWEPTVVDHLMTRTRAAELHHGCEPGACGFSNAPEGGALNPRATSRRSGRGCLTQAAGVTEASRDRYSGRRSLKRLLWSKRRGITQASQRHAGQTPFA